MLQPLAYIRSRHDRWLRQRLDENCGQIMRSLRREPLDFDAREPLWIKRFELLRRVST